VSTTHKTSTVTEQQDAWIKTQIAAGAFTNDSEYIRDLIRRDQASQADNGVYNRLIVKEADIRAPVFWFVMR